MTNTIDQRGVAWLYELTRHAIEQQDQAVADQLRAGLDDGRVSLTFPADSNGRFYASIAVDGYELARVALSEIVPFDDVIP